MTYVKVPSKVVIGMAPEGEDRLFQLHVFRVAQAVGDNQTSALTHEHPRWRIMQRIVLSAENGWHYNGRNLQAGEAAHAVVPEGTHIP